MGIQYLWQKELPPGVQWTVAFLFYLALIATILAGSAFLGFLGDAAGYVAPNTWDYATHPLFPFLSDQDTGHPLIYAWINGLFWRWLGIQPLVAYISIWIYAALALTSLQYLARRVIESSLGPKAPRWAGLAAALCLLATPLFISYSAQYLSAVPHLAFSLLMLAAWYAGRRGWLTLWALMLTFTRITGCLSVLGLGLFDFAREIHRHRLRRPKRLLLIMTPYLASGLLFVGYLFIKLIVLNRPMTTLAINEKLALAPLAILRQLTSILEHSFHYPRYSFALFLVPIGLALGLHRFGKKKSAAPPPTSKNASPSNRTVYAAFLCTVAPPAALYTVHALWPQPRWFLIHHALIILAGVHALFFLLRNHRRLVAVLLIGWCALQVLRWQSPWVYKVFPHHPVVRHHLAMHFPLNLNVIKQKQLYHELADWWHTHTPPQAGAIAAWPTYRVLQDPQGGFVFDDNVVIPIEWLSAEENRLAEFLQSAPQAYDRTYLIYCNRDFSQSQATTADVLVQHPEFRLERAFTDAAHNEIRVYDAAGTPHPTIDPNQSGGFFADRLYRILLGRMVDLQTFRSWSLTMQAAPDKQAAIRAALKAFVAYEEFESANPDSRRKLDKLFRVLLDRPPTKEELHTWMKRLDQRPGSIEELIDTLCRAPEFAALCSAYFPGAGISGTESEAAKSRLTDRPSTPPLVLSNSSGYGL